MLISALSQKLSPLNLQLLPNNFIVLVVHFFGVIVITHLPPPPLEYTPILSKVQTIIQDDDDGWGQMGRWTAKVFHLHRSLVRSRPARRWMDGGHVLVWVTPYRFGGSTWPVFCHLLLVGHHHEGVYFKREKFIRSIELLQRSTAPCRRSPGDDEWHTRSDLCAGARRWGRMLVCDFVKL